MSESKTATQPAQASSVKDVWARNFLGDAIIDKITGHLKGAGKSATGEVEDVEFDAAKFAGSMNARYPGAPGKAKDAPKEAFDWNKQTARNDASTKILDMMETSANAAKDAGQPLAHPVSAHGPGTDQTPRLLSGRRADEVVEDAINHPDEVPDDIEVGDNPDGTKAMLPGWDKVGNDPSNVSSRFDSPAQMLLAVEEAFAQSALKQSQMAANTKDLTAAAMENKGVTAAAGKLAGSRKTENDARIEVKTAQEQLDKAKLGSDKDAIAAAEKVLQDKADALEKQREQVAAGIKELQAAQVAMTEETAQAGPAVGDMAVAGKKEAAAAARVKAANAKVEAAKKVSAEAGDDTPEKEAAKKEQAKAQKAHEDEKLLHADAAAELAAAEKAVKDQPGNVRFAAEALGKSRKEEAATRQATKDAAGGLAEALKQQAAAQDDPAKEKAKLAVEAARKLLEEKRQAYEAAAKKAEDAAELLTGVKQVNNPENAPATDGGRQRIVVEPGGVIGESVAIKKSVDDPTKDAQPTLKTGDALTPEIMQQRFAAMETTTGIETASMILDPAHVKDEFGVKHRAGEQIQTAFPSQGEDSQRSFTGDDAKLQQARAAGQASLAPAQKALYEAQAEKRDLDTAVAKNAEDRKAIDAEIAALGKIDPDDGSPEDFNEKFALGLPDKYKNEADVGKAADKIRADIKAAAEGLAEIKKTKAALDEDRKKAVATVAEKTKELETAVKDAEKSASDKAAEQNTAALKQAADVQAEVETAAAGLNKAVEDAEKALKAIPPENVDDIKKAKLALSKARSEQKSALRQNKEAGGVILADLNRQIEAAEKTVAGLQAIEKKALEDVIAASKKVTEAEAKAGAEPQRSQFTDGNEKQQNGKFMGAKKSWDGAMKQVSVKKADVVIATTKATNATNDIVPAVAALDKLKKDAATLEASLKT